MFWFGGVAELTGAGPHRLGAPIAAGFDGIAWGQRAPGVLELGARSGFWFCRAGCTTERGKRGGAPGSNGSWACRTYGAGRWGSRAKRKGQMV